MNKIEKANTAVTVATATAMTAQTAYDLTSKDGKTMFIAENATSSAINLVVEAGEGLQGTENLTMAVPANSKICFALESGKYKKLYGENKGCVLFSGTGLKISTFILP
ncbi:MAG: hypothetical protein R3Y32_03580 [Bacillota bacterium]